MDSGHVQNLNCSRQRKKYINVSLSILNDRTIKDPVFFSPPKTDYFRLIPKLLIKKKRLMHDWCIKHKFELNESNKFVKSHRRCGRCGVETGSETWPNFEDWSWQASRCRGADAAIFTKFLTFFSLPSACPKDDVGTSDGVYFQFKGQAWAICIGVSMMNDFTGVSL